jgi:tetratricopeptide (TPR) repeat protein
MKPMIKVLALSLLLLAPEQGPVFAVDTPTTRNAPDLTAVRAYIKAKQWTSAIRILNGYVDDGVQHADVYNLLGFSLRKSGDQKQAFTYYRKALDFDPEHKGALEYLGELYVETGQIEKAKENLGKLSLLCPSGCEEREDLEAAISAAEKAGKSTGG